MKEDSGFPPGWDEARVRRLLEHYESQTEEQAVAEDEESLADRTQTVMEVPNELVPAVRDLLSRHPGRRPAGDQRERVMRYPLRETR